MARSEKSGSRRPGGFAATSRNRNRDTSSSGGGIGGGGGGGGGGGTSSIVTRAIFAFLCVLQLIAAVVVIGYYGNAIHKSSDKRPSKYTKTAFIYSEVVMSMAAITALILFILCFFIRVSSVIGTTVLFVWEWMLVILVAAVTGLMCQKYFRHKPEHATDWHDMRVAAGFDCASLILWFISALMGTVTGLLRGRKARY